MRAQKIAGIVAAAALGLVAAGFLVVWLIFDPNDYKADAELAFQQATGRGLHLQGRLAVTFFPWLAVTANQVSIDNRPGFGAEPLAALEKVRLGVGLWPLLREHRVDVDRISLDGLRLNLQVAPDGKDNWSDILERISEPKQEPEKSPVEQHQPLELRIAGVTMSRSHVSFDDRQAQTHYDIGEFELETGALHGRDPFEVKTSLQITRNDKKLGHVALQGRIDLTQPGVTLLEKVDAKFGFAGLGRDGAELPVAMRVPRLSLDSATRDIELDDFEAEVADSRLHTTLRVHQGAHGPTVRGPLQLESQPRKLLDTLGVAPPKTRDTKALGKLAAGAELTYSSQVGLRLERIDVKLDDTRLGGEISVRDLARLTIRFALRGDEINVDRYLPPTAPADKGKTAEAAPPPPGPRQPGPLRNLDIEGSLDLRRLVVSAIDMQQVHLGISCRDGQLRADPFVARVFGGHSTTRLTIDARAPVTALRVEESMRDIDVAAMLSQTIKVQQLTGRGTADFTIETEGTDMQEWTRSARGRFDLTVRDGTLIGADVWHEIEKALAAAPSVPGLGSRGSIGPDTGRTPFDLLHGEGTLGNRTLSNERLDFENGYLKVKGHGDVMFGANRLDLKLKARLLEVPEGRLLGIKASRIRGEEIPLDVTGRLDAPKVRPDVSAVLSAVAKSVVTEPLEGKGKKKLKKLLGL